MIIYGAVLLVAMLAMPGGVAGWLRARRAQRMRVVVQ
jgi:ABC-type branched-subunit amino acid transport system permease subunit